MAEDHKTEADLAFERYKLAPSSPPEDDVPQDDARDVQTMTKQSISQEPDAADVRYYTQSEMSASLGTDHMVLNPGPEANLNREDETADTENSALADVPDADDIQEDSPVDPASPPLEDMHGIDLINGYNGEDTEE